MNRIFTAAASLCAVISLAAPVAAHADAGEQIFKQRCQACHTVAPGGASGPIAPNLRGVVGRKAASTAFKGYSTALKASGLTWTKASLDTFLAAPGKMVPGTRMVVAVPAPADRAALVAYLAAQR